MKKEKTVRTYQRRTKSGKMVTVRQHTAKYDAADKMKEALKKKGAGDELEARKKKLAMEQLAGKDTAEEFEKMLKEDALKEDKKVESKGDKKTRASKKSEKVTSKKEPKSSKKETKSDQPFTAAEFKEWYEGTGSATDKKVAKELRKSLGRKAYNELNDLAADNYRKGGANAFFKKHVHSNQDTKSGKSREKATSESADTKGYGDMHLATLKKNYSDVSKQEKAETSKAKKKALQKDLIAMHSELSKRGYLVNYDRDGNINNIHKKNVSMAGQTVFFGTTPDWLRKVLGKNSDKIGIRMDKESKKESKNRGIRDVTKEIKDVEKGIKSLENLKKRQKKTGIGGNELAYNELRLMQLQKELASLQKGSKI